LQRGRGISYKAASPELLFSNPLKHDISMRLWYPFLSEQQPKIWDCSNYRNDGTIVDAFPAPSGQGWAFDGASGCISVPNDIFPGSGITGGYLYINPGVPGTGKLAWYDNDVGIGWQTAISSLQANVWQCITVTLGTIDLKFYINAINDSTITVTANNPWSILTWIYPTDLTSPQSILSRNDSWFADPTHPAEHVGCRNGFIHYFKGVIGDISVLNRELSMPEIFSYYQLTRSRFGV